MEDSNERTNGPDSLPATTADISRSTHSAGKTSHSFNDLSKKLNPNVWVWGSSTWETERHETGSEMIWQGSSASETDSWLAVQETLSYPPNWIHLKPAWEWTFQKKFLENSLMLLWLILTLPQCPDAALTGLWREINEVPGKEDVYCPYNQSDNVGFTKGLIMWPAWNTEASFLATIVYTVHHLIQYNSGEYRLFDKWQERHIPNKEQVSDLYVEKIEFCPLVLKEHKAIYLSWFVPFNKTLPW